MRCAYPNLFGLPLIDLEASDASARCEALPPI